jgi:hypothetical protein
VGDVEDHLAAISEAAADLFIERHEEPMHLEADSAGTGLALAGAGGCFAEVAEVFAANGIGLNMAFEELGAAVVDEDLEVHLGLAAEFIDVALKLALVGADGLAEGFVVVEDGAEAEGKNRGVLKAVGDDAGVVDAGLLIEVIRGVVFADDDGEVAGGVEKYLVAADADDGFEGNWFTMAG